MSKIEYIKSKINDIGLTCNTNQATQLYKYYEMIVEWNQKINLTSITNFEEVVVKHFIDSISLGNTIDLDNKSSLIDVGTGGGFPGIPLKIMYPHLEVCLLDSLNKRINFLNLVIESIGLNNIEAIHGRAEDIAKSEEYREKFDLCTSRAVANLSTLSEYCIPFVAINGLFISYKGNLEDNEIREAKKAISILGGSIDKITDFEILDTGFRRAFVIINKIDNTPNKYPRKAGKPKSNPLK